ncbi:MAG: ATP-binding protein [Sulfurovaceae bacterium]|nr:ATP-binding protein [Sulfurovaceae bacterium]
MTQERALIEILKNKAPFRSKIDTYIENIKDAEQVLNREFSLYHIEELTFEDDSPRKEALENVLGALRVEGINFVYLLLGDCRGVSFYFGIVKDKSYNKDLELDVDDIGRVILKSSIEGNFRGSKITELLEEKESIREKINNMSSFARIDGVPSVNEDNENFQGVDRLVDIMLGDEFGLMILADPLSLNEIEEIESSLYTVYNKLSPLTKKSVQETETTRKSIEKTDFGMKNDDKSTSNTTGSSFNETKSTATNKGTTESRDFADKAVNEWIEYIDEVLSKRVEYGRNKGLFHAGIYLLANNKGTLLKLGNTVSSLFSGIDDNKAPLKMTYIKNESEIKAVKNFQLPVTQLELSNNEKEARLLFSKKGNKFSSWLSTKELSVIAGLPQKEVVGLSLKEEVEFGLNIKNKKIASENTLNLGHLVRSGSELALDVFLDKSQLNKHTFITGVTGTGKTTTCHRILDAANIPFMVIEPAKTEYRILTQLHEDMLIFTLGDDKVAPFRLNPFEFFPHENITSRVDMIKANIEAAFNMEAAISQIIEATLYECYEAYGWDIATSINSEIENPFDDGVYAFPTMGDLINKVPAVVEKQGFDDRLKNDYIGSIKARLQSLLVGAKGLMLNTPRSIDFKDLVEKKVVLELEEIKNGSEKSLVMGFVLINLNEAIKAQHEDYKNDDKEFKHITLIEEAHRLLSKYMPGDNPNKKLGVETFADMLAEVRRYGESLIIVDQIPNKLTPEVLKNTNTKIVHKLFTQDDKEVIGNTMTLSDEQKDFLSNLEVGRAIVSSQDFAKPIQVQIKELASISTTTSQIIDKKDIRTLCLKYYQKSYKRGVIQGLEAYETEPSIEQIEECLSMKLSGLIKAWTNYCHGFSEDYFIKLQTIIESSGMINRLGFVAHVLTEKFYISEDSISFDQRIVHIEGFLKRVLDGDARLSEEDKAMLRIKIK